MTTSTKHRSVFATLRALVPERALTTAEALRITELQANRFRQLLRITEPHFDEAAIASLPRIEITREIDLPTSGLAQWHNGRWIIALNATESETRQHFSLAHELFHVLNHSTRHHLHPADVRLDAYTKGERLADHFAGCLLMPKRHVKALAAQGLSAGALADAFGVSVRAMIVRLTLLGITEPTPRCVRPVNSYRRVVKPYGRQRPCTAGVPA
jgi:Zn-dependent peptidase ImmA (M78 family)